MTCANWLRNSSFHSAALLLGALSLVVALGSPAAVLAQSQVSADVQLVGDGVLGTVTEIEAEPGGTAVIEFYGSGFSGAFGFTASLDVDNPDGIESAEAQGSSFFSVVLSGGVTNTATGIEISVGSLSAASDSGTDLKFIGQVTLQLSSSLTTLNLTLKSLAFQPGETVTSGLTLSILNPASIPKTVVGDLDIASGNQGQTTRRVNPGGRYPIQLLAGGMRGLTGYEIQAELEASAFVPEKSGFIVAPAFTAVPASTGSGLPAATPSGSARAGVDIQLAGDGAYSSANLETQAGPGDAVALEVFATGFESAFGFTAVITASNPAAVAGLGAATSGKFGISLSDPTISGGQISFNLGTLSGASAAGADPELVGTLLITLGPAISNGLTLTLSTLTFQGAANDVINVDAVLNVEPPGGLAPPLVTVTGNTISVKATADQPLDGKFGLGAITIVPDPSFRGGSVTLTRAILTMGEETETLELNQVFTLTSVQTDSPILNRPPVPVTVTDSRALIEWGTNKPSTSTVFYGTSADNLDQEVTKSDLVQNHRILLEGLGLGTRYFIQVQSTDAQGRSSEARPLKPFAIVTRSVPDTQPPRIIKGPAAFGIKTDGAQIVLNTDEAAKVDVTYGTTADALTQTESRVSTDLVHNVPLTGLSTGTTYFYKVKVTDLNGTSFETPEAKSFITRSFADDKGPIVLGRPTVVGRTLTGAVIAWRTNERATGALSYGTDKTALSDTAYADDADIEHRLSLTNLLADTTYFYSLEVVDATGNKTTTPAFGFTTRAVADTVAPKIVRPPIVPRVSNTEALIRWKTNEPATGAVIYGTSTDIFDDTNGTSGITVTSPDVRRKHEVVLTNLTPETVYYFQVSTTDLSGNGPTTNAGQLTFATRDRADDKAPVIFSRPLALGISDNSAIITWGADEPHSAVVSYRIKAAAKQSGTETFTDLVEDIAFERRHSVTLSDLDAGMTYEYQVETIDGAGNSHLSKVGDFTTRSGDDTTAPTIVKKPVARNITSSSATIDWITDEPSDSKVSYGTSTEYSETVTDQSPVRVHSVTLTDLEAGTKYHYAVGSADQSGNIVTTDANGTIPNLSKDHHFRTKTVAEEVAPVFLEGPLVEFTDALAIVKWKTDQLSTSRVVIGVVPGSSDASEDGATVFGAASQLVFEENDFVAKHNVTVTGLVAGKDYMFRASSTNASGQTVQSDDPSVSPKLQPPGGFGSFTTSTESDTQFPVITKGPTVVASTSSTLTVEWETDESGNSQASFGTSVDSLSSFEVEGTNVTTHQMVLTKLAAGQTYAYKIGSTDASGNGVTESDVAYGTTPSSVDLTAPVISTAPEVIYKTDRSATIRWETNEAADAQVSFGTAQGSLDEVRSNPDLETEHSITLTNLTAGTTYYVVAASTDQSGNGPAESTVLEFSTESAPDNTNPAISSVSVAPGDKTTTITWTTDELSDSAVKYGVTGGSLDFTAGSATDVKSHSVTLTNLTPATTYAYVVESIDRSGNGPAVSTSATFDTYAEGAVPPPATPAKPTTTAGNGTVKVTWSVSDATGITGYSLERSDAGGDYVTIATLGDAASYVDANVENGTAYQYRVTSMAQQVSGSASEASDAATPASDLGPDAPTVSLVQGDPLTPTFVIDNPTDASLSFTFQLSSTSEFADALALDAGVAQRAGLGSADAGLKVTAWTVGRTLTDGTTYHYRIKASDGTFDSQYTTGTYTADSNRLPYPGDISGGDLKVTFADFLGFLKSYNKPSTDAAYNSLADLKNDGIVNFTDFLQFLRVYNKQYVQGEGSSKIISTPGLVYGVDADARLQLVGRPVSSQSGDLYQVDATISQAADLRGFGLTVTYDPEKLVFVSATDGRDNLLEQDGRVAELFSTLTHDAAKGEVFLANAVSSGEPAAGDGLIARLRFRLLTDNPQGDIIRISEGLLIDGKFNVNVAQHLGDRLSLVPDSFALEQNYPNPFNPETLIRYAVPDNGRVTLRIYNVLGQEVATLIDRDHLAGYYAVRWNGRDRLDRSVASGVYLYRLQADGFAKVHKMLLLK